MGTGGAEVTGERLIHLRAVRPDGARCCPHPLAWRPPASPVLVLCAGTSSGLGGTVLMPRAGQGGPKITLPCFLALARAVPVASFAKRRQTVPTPSLLVTIP